MIKIECYISLKCGSEAALRHNISEALTLEDIEGDVTFKRIDDETGDALGLKGSPSVFIDGAEVQPGAVKGFS